MLQWQKFMEIKFNPFITDAFVEVVKDHKKSRQSIEALVNSFGEEKSHEIVKNIIISTLLTYRVNINDLIDHLKDRD